MKINLGLHLGFAINRYPEPKNWARLVNQKLGINQVQFVSDLLEPSFPNKIIEKQIDEINNQANKYNIKIDHTFTSPRYNFFGHPNLEISNHWLKWFKKFIDITASLNAKGTGCLLSIFSVNDYKFRRELIETRIIKKWKELSLYAKNKKLEYLLWEPMSIKREMGETIKKTNYLNDKLNKNNKGVPINICLDVDHGDISSKNLNDHNPYKWIELLGQKSPVLHIKQRTNNVYGHKPFTKEYNKEGIIKPKKIIKYLKYLDLDEIYLYLELSFREREPFESKVIDDLRESIEYWKKYINL